ncbi:thiolase family protein [Jiulongibacter sediminis]|uniref:Acetyl-CoA acetyltransferase n=1 Tax=Jiulongibacter sediminis TaxID=1605367 RepID=A0A0P7BRI5_9BACT|nr:hypothetical protein [Jiulongibacter sediminis]KPM46920.1 hypothetical protein AFM12_16940 [Jiulongibacter sediminis]TBX22267.1 hypothetical protein TK44_16950 [Jiulongibacter sediminis]
MINSFIYDIVRVPTGKRGGYYKKSTIEEAAAFLIDSLIERNNLYDVSIELLLANSIGTMGNMARYSALLSRLKLSSLSSTIDLQCGGGYQALRLGSSLVQSGMAESALVGGLESNSLRPERRYHRNDPRRPDDEELEVADFSPLANTNLNLSAQKLGEKYNIASSELNKWTLSSHQKAQKFTKTEAYGNHVLDVENQGRIDQTIRFDLTKETLERASNGLYINRTNTAHYHDGACIALLSGEGFGDRHRLRPMARLRHVELIGIDPDTAPEGAIIGVENLFHKLNLDISEIDLFEINESFGVKPLAFSKHFGVSEHKINVLGGNLAFGHPYAASGMMNLMHLVLALKQENRKFGLLSAGVAGGFGASVVVENLS